MKLGKLLLVSALFVAFALRPARTAQVTCAGYDPDFYGAYSFFEPLSFAELSQYDYRYDSVAGADNLKEWHFYFKNKPKIEDVQALVYQMTANEMQKIRAAITNANAYLPANIKNNSAVRYLTDKKDLIEKDALEAVDYLFYAKTCEPEAQPNEEWSERKRDTGKMRWLADAGKRYYRERAANDFLKLRFAYQAIRMAHYVGDYDKAVRFYDEMVTPISEQTQSIIRDWCLAHKAGALHGLNRYPEGNYWFSVVFARCPSRRASSYLSFRVRNDADWRQTLAFTRNPEERATLYFMRSLASQANGLAELQNVYREQAASIHLPFMLMREINRLEDELLDIDLNKNLFFNRNVQTFGKAEAYKVLQSLKNFVNQCVSERKTSRPEIFQLAQGYLEYLGGNTTTAQKIFSDISKASRDKVLRQQAEVFSLAIQMAGINELTEQVENELYEQVRDTKHRKLLDLFIAVCGRLYAQQNQMGKAYLCKFSLYDLRSNPNIELIDNLLELASEKKPSKFEQEQLLSKLSVDKYNAKEVLNEMKATYLFGQDKIEEAIALYQQVSNDLIGKIAGDPLQANLNDCQECVPSAGRGKYNRLTLAQKILALRKAAERNTVDQAQILFQLGNIYYNMTWFGTAWEAVDYYRSGSDLRLEMSKRIPKDKDNFFGDIQVTIFTDCSKAKMYFDRAMTTANRNGNRELAAQACYMAAKCEQNQFFMNAPIKNLLEEFTPLSFKVNDRRYFNRLKQDFNNTNYYREVLRECRYFNTFVKLNR